MMSVIGRVDSVWRYPVKSMRGEELPEIFAAFAGVYGDRLFAFKSSAAPSGFPYLTGREAHDMLLFRPAFAIRRRPGSRRIWPRLRSCRRSSIPSLPIRAILRSMSRRPRANCWPSATLRCSGCSLIASVAAIL